MSLFIDFHVLQTVPPSCVNRDDTGSPKTAVYGGTVRSRVSSQAWKHAMRIDFQSLFAKEELGSRTKYLVDMVAAEIQAQNSSLDTEKCKKLANEALKDAGISLKDDKTEALFFMSCKQAQKLAELALNDALEKKEKKDVFKNVLKENPSVDIALFGRMAASDPTLKCDAAAQVAHAISTHAVQTEYDYFTAVDDLQADDNAGAGHLGTVEFNSATLYRYANINADELKSTLGAEKVAKTVRCFAESFIRSMPTGKENTFANRTLPDAVYITIRSDQPVNLCGAFEKAVKESADGFAAASEQCLTAYAKKVYSRFAAEPEKAFCIGDSLAEIAESLSMPCLLDALEQAVTERMSEV